MKKKTIKKSSYTENQVRVILEDLRSQFMAFGEGQQILSDKVDKIDKKVDKIDERLSRVEDNVTEIKHKLSEKVDLKDFQKLEKRMIRLEKLVFAKLK